MDISLKESRLGVRNSTTRIPFRYGVACMTECPQAMLEVTIETKRGLQCGYAADCLPPLWFDKSPNKDFPEQIDDMVAVINAGRKYLGEELQTPVPFFPAWQIAYERIHERAAEWQLTPLLASFGLSMVERAVMDAMARAANLPFAVAVRENLYQIDAGAVHSQLAGIAPAEWLPAQPKDRIYVRHTVGLGDPLTAGEIPAEERLEDGLPQALEEYVAQTGLAYFKIKVGNQLDRDVDRLRTIAAIVEKYRSADYQVTLDGNEQYKSAPQFDQLIAAIRQDSQLKTLYDNILVIEQPLERSIALDPAHTGGIRELGKSLPVIIDESDGRLQSYPQAIELGYRGVSSKNCKGPIKSLLNAGLTWLLNDRGRQSHFVMTGEDLCCVGIVSVQADLCLVATLGLEHVERNGHHFHPGLTYLPPDQRLAALEHHGDFYHQFGPTVGPHIVDGQFRLSSMHCPGFGFAVLPNAEDWSAV